MEINVKQMFAVAAANRLDKSLVKARQDRRVDKSVPTPAQEYVVYSTQREEYTRTNAVEFSGIVARKREERLAKRNPWPVKQGKTTVHLSMVDNTTPVQVRAEILPLVWEMLMAQDLPILRALALENGLSWPTMDRDEKQAFVNRLYSQVVEEVRP